MPTTRTATQSRKKAVRSLQQARESIRRSTSLSTDTANVIGARAKLAAVGLMDVTRIDYSEFSKLVPEKVWAFSASGAALTQRSLQMSAQMSVCAATELLAFSKQSFDLAVARTPYDAALIQTKSAWALWQRMMGQWGSLGAMMTRAHHDVAAPIARIARANAARLTGSN